MAANLIILGEAPGNYPKYDHERHALFPYPARCSGARLCEFMGMRRSEYIDIRRRNLLDFYPGKLGKGARFPIGEARKAVTAIYAQNELTGSNILLVGMRLAEVFGYKGEEILTWHHRKAYNYAIVPHTSGICRWWSNEDNKEQGVAFLHRVAEQVRACALSFN